MDAIKTVIGRMRQQETAPALFWQGAEFSYAAFCRLIDAWGGRLREYQIGPGTVCGLLGDFSPQTSALIFALMEFNSIVVPFSRSIERELPGLLQIGGVQRLFRFDAEDQWTLDRFENVPPNDLVVSFGECGEPGLIVFTSGSSGKPKGILHDFERVMRKFAVPRQPWRTVLFLTLDHFGGINTFLSAFAYGGVGICVPNRGPEVVCRTIEQSRATLLPTTPTFLNLLLASGCYSQFDLSSLKLITYGTEVMPDATLRKLHATLPQVEIKQTYGLSELGVLRSKSQEDHSPWVKIGGQGFEVKVVDNVLWVRSESNMVGYLNAPSPFDSEGWMCTGDEVEVRGEYMRILGRRSEIINVGGQKVFPMEVETVLLEADNVRDATVYGSPDPLMGQVVNARVTLAAPEDPQALTQRLRKFCLERMARYKVPMRFRIISADEQRSERFKKVRSISETSREP